MEALAAAGWKPEWKPVALLCIEMGWHGLSKVDCVAVWLPATNWNWMLSPTDALRLSGEYFSVPLMPTVTTQFFWAVPLC
jgi:hypothetical protein